MTTRDCAAGDLDAMLAVINDAAVAYRGVIPADCWREPYMSREELEHEIGAGVRFHGAFDDRELVAVMGLQDVQDVALVRHAYTRTSAQRRGVGAMLLQALLARTDRRVLIGTWAAATWAIRFYERHGFRVVEADRKDALLRRYWRIPQRQIASSIVLENRA